MVEWMHICVHESMDGWVDGWIERAHGMHPFHFVAKIIGNRRLQPLQNCTFDQESQFYCS